MIEDNLKGYASTQIDKALSYMEGFSKGYHQAKSEWVGLTRMELIKCGVLPFGMSYKLYQAIEAKLKEKNYD